MSSETGTEAHSIVDSMPGENGLEAWRRPGQRFDAAPAHANLSIKSEILKPPRGEIDNLSPIVEKWEEMVRRRDGRTGRQALTDDTKRAIIMDMCESELERDSEPNSDRHDTNPKVHSATMDH